MALQDLLRCRLRSPPPPWPLPPPCPAPASTPCPLPHGTTTLAFRLAQGVVAAADTRSSCSTYVALPSLPKVLGRPRPAAGHHLRDLGRLRRCGCEPCAASCPAGARSTGGEPSVAEAAALWRVRLRARGGAAVRGCALCGWDRAAWPLVCLHGGPPPPSPAHLPVVRAPLLQPAPPFPILRCFFCPSSPTPPARSQSLSSLRPSCVAPPRSRLPTSPAVSCPSCTAIHTTTSVGPTPRPTPRFSVPVHSLQPAPLPVSGPTPSTAPVAPSSLFFPAPTPSQPAPPLALSLAPPLRSGPLPAPALLLPCPTPPALRLRPFLCPGPTPSSLRPFLCPGPTPSSLPSSSFPAPLPPACPLPPSVCLCPIRSILPPCSLSASCSHINPPISPSPLSPTARLCPASPS
uniref:Uncharacterized protein n=1 Tax=Chelonoidis abingdonii TaxID=106734 RepID=A0A8C0G4P1_CHEAB